MLAALNRYGQTALFLAQRGTSLFVKDKDGITLLQTAKTALRQLSEREWSEAKTPIYASQMGSSEAVEQVSSRNRFFQDIKERNEAFNYAIDLCLALKPERDIKNSALARGKIDNLFRILQRNELQWPRVSFSKVFFETNMAKEVKTFAFLDRGKPFEHMQAAAVSGYTAGPVGDSDGCLNRNLWTARVMKHCKVIGHELAQTDEYPQFFHASHAEKQLKAYFLWMHTTVDVDFEDNNDEVETWGNCQEMYDLQICKPDLALMKKDIYVSREPCKDCKDSQQRSFEKTGIHFYFFFVKPIVT
ncbi:hypothetical protein BJ878DRAFT_247750 [Calycina marina]|uniref:Single-strand DNA deaminase toxin A-like C-terminal domain-containing protein n=1 Tax=Calycina marina TaxID=1763456 RepID=A0A9P8CH43_9HELO|nr:hypothetical protein BJ878DRAFT_247750 [Calycina marina]